MQITSAPATVAISINHDNYTNKCIKDTGIFAVNILGENVDPIIIGSFGFRSGKDVDKFEGIEPLVKEFTPVLPQAMSYITCKVINTMETDIFKKAGNDYTFKKIKPVTAYKVAKFAYKKSLKGKRIAIVGIKNRFLVFICRFFPRNFVTMVSAKNMKKE